MEFLEETFPNVKLLPKDALTRAKVFAILVELTIIICAFTLLAFYGLIR